MKTRVYKIYIAKDVDTHAILFQWGIRDFIEYDTIGRFQGEMEFSKVIEIVADWVSENRIFAACEELRVVGKQDCVMLTMHNIEVQNFTSHARNDVCE